MPAVVDVPLLRVDGPEGTQAADAPRQIGRWPLDKPFPVTLIDADLMAVLGRGHSSFYKLKAAGAFKFLEVRPQVPGATLYSGRLVERWVRGEFEEPRYFSRARGLRETAPDAPRRRPGRPRKSVATEE